MHLAPRKTVNPAGRVLVRDGRSAGKQVRACAHAITCPPSGPASSRLPTAFGKSVWSSEGSATTGLGWRVSGDQRWFQETLHGLPVLSCSTATPEMTTLVGGSALTCCGWMRFDRPSRRRMRQLGCKEYEYPAKWFSPVGGTARTGVVALSPHLMGLASRAYATHANETKVPGASSCSDTRGSLQFREISR